MHDEAAYSDLSDLLRFDEPPGRLKRRRQDPRLLTIFRVGKLTTDRFEELCLIRNVGVGGMTADVHSPLVARQRVRIELRSDRKLWGSVLWLKDGRVGIGFDDQVGLDEVLARSDGPDEGRRLSGPRLNIGCEAELRVDASYYPVLVNDLGQTGAGIALPEILPEGQDVTLRLEGFRPVHGSTRWCRNGRVGIAFNKPIPFGELTHWLQEKFGRPCVPIHAPR
jgi:hypothetical protein